MKKRQFQMIWTESGWNRKGSMERSKRFYADDIPSARKRAREEWKKLRKDDSEIFSVQLREVSKVLWYQFQD